MRTAAVKPVFTSDAQVKTAAHDLLVQNSRSKKVDGKTYRFTVPSPSQYPYQWFWDSCFHAMVWSEFDRNRAADEIRSLLHGQRKDGFIPHVIFWDQKKMFSSFGAFVWQFLESKTWFGKPKTSEQIQPPVLAQAVQKIVDGKRNDGFAKDAFLRDVYPKLLKYYAWLFKNRDPDGDGLISIISPSESGLDFAPCYDDVLHANRKSTFWLGLKMRWTEFLNKVHGYNSKKLVKSGPFSVEDVLVNSVLIEALDSMAALAKELPPDVAKAHAKEIEGLAKKRSLAFHSLVTQMWDEKKGVFVNLNGKKKKHEKVVTVGCLMPLILPGLPPKMAASLVNELRNNFGQNDGPKGVHYGVPHVPTNSPLFHRHRQKSWTIASRNSGPSWLMTDGWLAQGARQYGAADVANHIQRGALDGVEKSGFREFFDTETGEGLGAKDFGWSSLAALITPPKR